jgi:hypothetical protein
MPITPTHEFVVGEDRWMGSGAGDVQTAPRDEHGRPIGGAIHGPGTRFPIGDEVRRDSRDVIVEVSLEEPRELVKYGMGTIRPIASEVDV